ncbi:hypothetical protein G7Y89_g9726 [Cudoniella acicularis]|uniref:Uncharacterized protein n=1 Tax=Cudoniella acicularis TaxID=354080 RepID=A0A8H4RFN3_9HELO|nr:hypothetical protein G7Y89_g9726 [Cudoniella acicularis]
MALASTSKALRPLGTDEEFPSGSKWGIPHLDKLKFAHEPQIHPFSSFQCKELKPENAEILERLKVGFGIEDTDLKSGFEMPSGCEEYKAFYEHLAVMMPKDKIRVKPMTPRRPATRSSTNLPLSSDPPSSSPWSVGYGKRSTPTSTQSTPLRPNLSETVPQPLEPYPEHLNSSPFRTPKRQRHSSTISPGLPTLPTRTATPPKDETTPTQKAREAREVEEIQEVQELPITSSQTDSTYHTAESVDISGSEDEKSDGDRAEFSVTSVIQALLWRICAGHNGLNRWVFEPDYANTLRVPICGDFAKTTPDLAVTLKKDRKQYHILDIEACSLNSPLSVLEMTNTVEFRANV